MRLKIAPKRLVFISHSGTDTYVAKKIASDIQRAGARVFLDEAHVEVGAEFEERILNFLNRAHELVVLVTPWALERPYVWAELGAAWGRQIHIIAVLHGITAAELQARPGVPVFLKQRDMIDINDFETYLRELKRRMRKRKAKAHADGKGS